MYNRASELYNDLLQTYSHEYYNSLDAKRSKIGPKYDPTNLTLDEYDYSEWYKELDDLLPLEMMKKNVIVCHPHQYQNVKEKKEIDQKS